MLSLRGWSFDPDAGQPARSIWLNVGEKRFLLFSSVPRPDVARFMRNNSLTAVGFDADIPLDAIPPGDFPLRFAVIGSNGKKLHEVTKNIRLLRDASGGARLDKFER